MNKVTKVIGSSIIALSFAGVAFAIENAAENSAKTSPSPEMSGQYSQQHQMEMGQGMRCMGGQCKHGKQHAKQKNFSASWNHALHALHPLTSTEAKTVAEAAVLLYGDSTMKVGTVTPIQGKHNQVNYDVQITNQQGQAIGAVVMNGVSGQAMHIKH